jgi:hypothetical protein
MTRFAEWCTEVVVGCSAPHSHTMLTADASKFDAAVAIVADVVPEHFLPPSRLADMFARLQRHEVAELIQNRLPESAQLKSGDLGEVLCTTFVREKTPFTLGIRRLQFKDHRNMSMRGDDMSASLGIGIDAPILLDVLNKFSYVPRPHTFQLLNDWNCRRTFVHREDYRCAISREGFQRFVENNAFQELRCVGQR